MVLIGMILPWRYTTQDQPGETFADPFCEAREECSKGGRKSRRNACVARTAEARGAFPASALTSGRTSVDNGKTGTALKGGAGHSVIPSCEGAVSETARAIPVSRAGSRL
jgi:hypothetical protein